MNNYVCYICLMSKTAIQHILLNSTSRKWPVNDKAQYKYLTYFTNIYIAHLY